MDIKFRPKIALFVLSIGSLVLCFACDSGTPRMVEKKYPQGFSINHPESWSAQVIDKKYIWLSAQEEAKSSFIVIYPFFLGKNMDSRSWLEQNIPQLTQFFEQPSLEKVGQLRAFPDEAACRFLFRKDGSSYVGIALCSIYEKSGVLYVLAAPGESFERQKHQLITMLESFRFESAEEGVFEQSVTNRIRYRPWQDPVENAFTIDIPQGWSATGGTFRRAAVDLVHVLETISPDQKIKIRFNDENLPVFAIPTQMLLWSGFREGSWYSPGYGVNMLVKRYLPGQRFLLEYLDHHRQNFSAFSIVEQKDRPDIVANFNKIWAHLASAGISFTRHAGDAAFRFIDNGEPFVGYGLAVTQVVQSMAMGGGGNWNVELLLIYYSPEDQMDSVKEIATHMFQSIRMNPVWVASQQMLTANVSQVVAQTSREIARIIDESYWSRQAVMDNVSRKFSNYILGVTDVVDPETGETWKVEAGHNYYWRKNHTNVIVGTEIAQRPDIDFSLLREF